MGYLEDINNRYSGENEKLNKVIRFRANIIVLQMIYENLLVVIPQTFKQWQISDMGKQCLYSMIGTNRTDFSKMYNGHIYEARKKMFSSVKSNEYMMKVLGGESLIKIGKMDSVEQWKRLFSGDIKKGLEETNTSINIWVNNVSREKYEDGLEYQCCKWMMERIIDYVRQQNDTIDRIVNEKVQGFRVLTFDELDNCHPDTIKNMYKDVRKVFSYIDRIYKYKCDK